MKKIKRSNNNNKFKVSAQTWIDKFELPDGLYSASSIIEYQDYFDCTYKRHNEKIDNPSVKIYVNKMEIKTGYYLKLLTSDTMKLLGSTENKKIKMVKMSWNYWSSIISL